MTTLLTCRDAIKNFYARYDHIFTPILKGITAFVLLYSIHLCTGYMAVFGNVWLVLGLAVVCAVLSSEFTAGIGMVIIILQASRASLDSGLVAIAFMLIFYFGYMRFAPKSGVIVLFVPLLYMLHLPYALPVVLGFLVGPLAMIPAGFGILIQNFETTLTEVVNMKATATDAEEGVQAYMYILQSLIENKEMWALIVIFAVVILVTYLIYRTSFEHSWIVAFVVGTVLNVVGCLVANVMLDLQMPVSSVVLQSVLGILVAFVIQFVKGIVDYQRTERLQFEDDNYYYYVTAIPKLSVAESNKNVRHINTATVKKNAD